MKRIKRLLRPTNGNIRLLVGLLLAGLAFFQFVPVGAESQKANVVNINEASLTASVEVDLFSKVKKWAEDDHIALLEYSLKNCEKYHDYTCTLVKQEVIKGSDKGQQMMDVKFRDTPFSVVMKWISEGPDGTKYTIPMGDSIIYVEGMYDNQMLVRPSGIWRRLGTVKRAPDGADAMRNTLRPVNMFGFKRGMQNLLDVYVKARDAGDLQVKSGGFAKVNGRETIVLVRYLPAKGDYPAYETKTYIDLEWFVPIQIEGLDWDKKFQCRYTYSNVKFNVGLKEGDFLPENNEMAKPK